MSVAIVDVGVSTNGSTPNHPQLVISNREINQLKGYIMKKPMCIAIITPIVGIYPFLL